MNQLSRLKLLNLLATAKYGDTTIALNPSAPIFRERYADARTFIVMDWQERTNMLPLTDHICTLCKAS
jgi:hypothetical protein